MTIECPKCQTNNPDTSSYCADCGTQLGPARDIPAFTKTLETPYPQFKPGTSLVNRYEIISELGKGGMGEVYLAEDTNLKRHVAVKVLPQPFGIDKERLARFEREARLLASLNHPNIATIHGLEKSDNQQFLVMELVEGDTLAEMLKKGSLPIDESLEICRQIAEGLESAHERGIIHRDLKPANIKVTPEGKVKILDFGIAKAFRDQPDDTDSSKSPTITDEMTEPGIVLGTAAYMSPEQAKGKAVDKRTDIWAFGCILFECLTGKRVFEGETASDTIASILKGEPDWNELPASTHTSIRALIQRCLRKDKNRRQHDISDTRIEIEDALANPPSKDLAATSITGITGWKSRLTWTLVGLILGSIITGILIWKLIPIQPSSITKAIIGLQPAEQLGTQRIARPSRTSLAISPDGRFLVYSGIEEESSQLFLRKMDEADAKPISGTEGGDIPFLSPDGNWVGFLAEGKLKKVPISGGNPIPLCEHPDLNWGVSWGSNDKIVFSDYKSLWCVSAAGGKAERFTTTEQEKGELGLLLPQMLPGGEAVLFTIQTSSNRWDNPQIAAMSLLTGERKVIVEEGADARYVSTGHIIFVRRGTLYVLGFDPNKLKTFGSPAPLPLEVMQAMNAGHSDNNTFAAQLSISTFGTLVYVTGGANPDPVRKLVWLDRRGVEEALTASTAPYFSPRISPDGKRIVHTTLGKNRNIYVYEIERGTSIPLIQGGFNRFPIWTPDGKNIIYDVIGESERGRIMQIPADGSGEPTLLISSQYSLTACSWSQDGKLLAFVDRGQTTGNDIWVLQVEDGKRVEISCTEFFEGWPELSPDGRWVAYATDETGRFEVWMQPYPPTGRKFPISTQGGGDPAWSPDGRELFYWSTDGLWVVEMNTRSDSPIGRKRLLPRGEFVSFPRGSPSRSFDISPDGQRFLLPMEVDGIQEAVTEINIVLNWFEELKHFVPQKK